MTLLTTGHMNMTPSMTIQISAFHAPKLSLKTLNHLESSWEVQANKVKGVRAALVWSIETAKLAREHNNANVIAVGGRMHEADFVKQLIDTFIATPFPGDERHQRRIKKVSNYEITGDL
jgi:hypothetical protein